MKIPLEEQISKRKAERGLTSSEKDEIAYRREGIRIQRELIEWLTERANQRTAGSLIHKK